MWRTVVFFTEVAVAVAVVIWFLDRPGEVFIEWQGWELETSFGVMALAILILCIFPEIVTWLPDKIMGKPLGY